MGDRGQTPARAEPRARASPPDPDDHAGDRDLVGDDQQVVVDERGRDQQGQEDRMVGRGDQLKRGDLPPRPRAVPRSRRRDTPPGTRSPTRASTSG